MAKWGQLKHFGGNYGLKRWRPYIRLWLSKKALGKGTEALSSASKKSSRSWYGKLNFPWMANLSAFLWGVACTWRKLLQGFSGHFTFLMHDRWHFELGELVVPASLLHSKCHFASRKDIITAQKCLNYVTFSLVLQDEYFNYLPTWHISQIDHVTSATGSKLSPKRFSRVLNS